MKKRAMATRLMKGRSSRQQQTVKQEQVKQHALPVTESLKSTETERQYLWHFNTFKKWMTEERYPDSEPVDDDKLLEFDRETLERDIMDYLKYRQKEEHQKHSSINSSMSAILRFCRVNAIMVNKERISLLVPEDENRHKDRAYTDTEIRKLLKESDKRFRVIFLLLTHGLRIGAIPELNIGHLKEWPLPTDDPIPPKVYQLFVYEGTKSEHYTFLTPELTEAIDDYKEFREDKAHEQLTDESPLIREQFPLYNKRDDAAIPKRMSKSSLQKTIQRILKKAGLDNSPDDIMLTHGFRKYCITMMKKAKIDWSDREFFVGHRHSRGLDVQYDKTDVEDRLFEWSKCINLLTIENKSYHLEKEIEQYKDEYDKKIAQLETLNAKLETDLNALWKMQNEQNEVIRQIKGLPSTKSKDKDKDKNRSNKLENEIGIIEDCGDSGDEI